MSGNIRTLKLQTNNASSDQQDYAIIVTAFHYYFLRSAQLSRVSTICCLDTPLCTNDQDSARESSSGAESADHYSPNTDIKRVMTCHSIQRQTNSSFNSSNCHYSYRLLEAARLYALDFILVKSNPNPGLEFFKPKTRDLKKELGFANPMPRPTAL